MSPLRWAGGEWLRLSRSEMLDYDLDPDEGRDDDDDLARCVSCDGSPCTCADDEEEE